MSFFEAIFSWTGLCTMLLLFVGVLLMFIVLLQRGRGGGLAGAFGGLGGQSAFGTKAGDVFTKITVVLATVWVLLAGVTGFAMRHDAAKGFKAPEKPPAVELDPNAKTQEAPAPKEDNQDNTDPTKKDDSEKQSKAKDSSDKKQGDLNKDSDIKKKTGKKSEKENPKKKTEPKANKDEKNTTKEKPKAVPKKTKKD